MDPETSRLLEQFESCTLSDPFHHEQHVRVAWAMLEQEDLLAAHAPDAYHSLWQDGLRHISTSPTIVAMPGGRPQEVEERREWRMVEWGNGNGPMSTDSLLPVLHSSPSVHSLPLASALPL